MSVLPKQWRHWCSLANLKPVSKHSGYKRKQWGWWYLKGYGRYWRVNCHQQFECGDTYERFDRWAVSDNIERSKMPKTYEEFLIAVNTLLEKQELYKKGSVAEMD